MKHIQFTQRTTIENDKGRETECEKKRKYEKCFIFHWWICENGMQIGNSSGDICQTRFILNLFGGDDWWWTHNTRIACIF